MRYLRPQPGGVIMRREPFRPRDFDRAAQQLATAVPQHVGEGEVEIRDFSDLVAFLTDKIDAQAAGWVPNTAPGTNEAFLRRLIAMGRRLGQLVRCDAEPLMLNKYAPRHGTSPIKEILVDIAARGRSLGAFLSAANRTRPESTAQSRTTQRSRSSAGSSWACR
jgi:hypothetical protein